jgi:hypothetical protein
MQHHNTSSLCMHNSNYILRGLRNLKTVQLQLYFNSEKAIVENETQYFAFCRQLTRSIQRSSIHQQY